MAGFGDFSEKLPTEPTETTRTTSVVRGKPSRKAPTLRGTTPNTTSDVLGVNDVYNGKTSTQQNTGSLQCNAESEIERNTEFDASTESKSSSITNLSAVKADKIDLMCENKIDINTTMYVDRDSGFIKLTHESKVKLPQTIRLTNALFDGGANINVTSGTVNNAFEAKGTISAWDESKLTAKLTIGTRGRLKKCLQRVGNSVKEIVVPGHTRTALGGAQIWIYNSAVDAHFLLYTPSKSSNLENDDFSVIIAVYSPATNNIECCTAALFDLLEIDDYTLTGVEYALSIDVNNKLCISGNSVPSGSVLEIDTAERRDENENIGFDKTLGINTQQCLFEINHSKYDDRWPMNPVTVVTAQMGGWSMSTFVKVLRNKTMQGLDWVTNDMIVKAKLANNHSEILVGLEKFRAPPRSLRRVNGIILMFNSIL